MEPKIVKVCGMRNAENIQQVAALGVDWIGMVFCKASPRNVTMIPTYAGIIPDRASDVVGHASERDETAAPATLGGVAHYAPKRVGVFVDEMPQNIITRVVNFQLDIVQLHGHETPTLIRNLRRTLDPDIRPGIKFVKAISVSSREDIATWKDYADCVDFFLFDTKLSPVVGHDIPATLGGVAHYGGSGRQFDWSLLDAYNGDVPFLLSGGIGPDDTQAVKDFHHLKCVGIDLNSRFETEPGAKDVERLRTFLQQIRDPKN